MKRIIISFFAAAALVGCAKELTPDQSADQVTVKPGPLVEFSTSFADATPQSRVALDHQTGKLSWSEGDQVAVVLTDGTNYSYDETTYTVNHETGTLAIPDNSAYVIYPASQKGTLSGTTVSLKLPETHSVKTPEAAFDNALMKGVVSGTKIEFKNLLGFFKVPVTGEGKLKSAVLRTICRTTKDFHPISGSATLELSKDVTSDGAITMGTNNAAFAWVRYNFTGDVNLADNQSVYFAVPAGQYDNMGVVLVSDKGSKAIYASNSHSVERSTVKPVSASALNLANHTAKSPVSLVGTTDDPQENYANCYMVPPTAGYYEFDCILADGTNLKDGVTAEIKWAEQAGLINDLYYNPETNKISFKTNGQEGNALIVLTTNTSKAATHIWTWHIWITDTPKVLNLNSGTTPANQYYVMDRVVGATWAPASTIDQTTTQSWTTTKDDVTTTHTAPMTTAISSADASDACGVYFQYQNRNPLPRINNIDYTSTEDISTMLNSRCAVMYGTSQYGQYWSSSTSGGNVWQDETNGHYLHNGITYPNYQYKASAPSGDAGWIKADLVNDSNKWNYTQPAPPVKISAGYRFWNSPPTRNHDEMISGKTTHDPCPPGYIIESSTDSYHYVNTRKTTVGFARAATDSDKYTAGFRFYGMYLNIAKTEDNQTVALYFPCGGARYACTSNLVASTYGNMGYFYAANVSDSRNGSYKIDNDTYTYHYGFAEQYGASKDGKTIDWPSWASEKKVNGQAYHVRCRRGKF